jgi:hypothetical protein
LVDVPDIFLLPILGIHPSNISIPELIVKGTGNETTFIQEGHSLETALDFFKVKIFSPVHQLWLVQLSNMEIRPFYLGFVCPSLGGFSLSAGEDLEMEAIDPSANLAFNLELSSFHLNLLLASLYRWRRICENLLPKLG